MADVVVVFCRMVGRPSWSTLFPYTTLFRSLFAPRFIWRTSEDAHFFPGGNHNRYGQEKSAHLPKSRSEEHTSELQSHVNLVCRLLLEKKNPRWMSAVAGACCKDAGVRSSAG